MKKDSVKIGVIGSGTVGSCFIRHFTKKRQVLKKKTGIDFYITKVFDRNLHAKKVFSPALLAKKIEEITKNDDIDIVVELIGGIEPACAFIKESMRNGKSVVTANKALISEKGPALFELAERHKVFIGFEASVASAIPIVKSLQESFIGSDINRFMAILNGTTNYILSQMSLCGGNFSQALTKAQKAGYAESNPVLDIEGMDTAHKLSILCALAFNKSVSWKDIFTEGIKKIDPIDIEFAKDFGYRIKLLAIAKKKGESIELRVHPTFIPENHLLSSVEGVYNAVYIEGDMAGKSLMYGEGAGGNAAASAAIADVIDIGKKLAGGQNAHFTPLYENNKMSVLNIKDIHTRYYFRFTVPDKPGILAMITDVLGKNGISIASVIQKEKSENYAVPIVILTHRAKEEAMVKSIRQIDRLSIIKIPTVAVRVED